jgi:hypothetical protein
VGVSTVLMLLLCSPASRRRLLGRRHPRPHALRVRVVSVRLRLPLMVVMVVVVVVVPTARTP